MNNIHGEYKLALSGNIICTVVVGPWNTECVECFMRDYYQLIMPLHGSRWGDLIILHGESLLIPAAEHLLTKAISISCSKGLTDVALVSSHSSVQSSAEAQFFNIYKPFGLNLHISKYEAQGLAWLQQQGLHCDNTEILRKLA
ncbi:hypothetical protein [Paraglaciecola sp.]|uniref:hypothetical protein n=1 Tax=Paraglaciecola sp. TaxID=1920173 RepID=UPI0030F474BE